MTLKSAEDPVAISIRRMVDEVVRLFPATGIFIAERGDQSLETHAASLFADGPGISEDLIRIIKSRAVSLGQPELAIAATEQLRKCPAVLTADHHGLLFQPWWFQGDLLAGWGAHCNGRPVLPVFACGNVPLNNKSLPKTVSWNGVAYSLYPSRDRHKLVYGCEGVTGERWKELPEAIQLIVPFDRIADQPFADQASIINSSLWQSAFETKTGFPSLLYLQMEDLTRELWNVSYERQDEIYHLCFSREHRDFALKQFDGIGYCWSGVDVGSHLFWNIDSRGRSASLRYDGDDLVGDGVRHSSDPERVFDLVQSRTLVLGSFLSYTLLLKHGVRPIGGPNQLEALPRVSAKWQEYLAHFGFVEEQERQRRSIADGTISGLYCLYDASYNERGLDFLLQHTTEAMSMLRRRVRASVLEALVLFWFPLLTDYHLRGSDLANEIAAIPRERLARAFHQDALMDHLRSTHRTTRDPK